MAFDRRLANVASDGLFAAYNYPFGRLPISRSGQQAPDMPVGLPGMNANAPCMPKCSKTSALNVLRSHS